MIRMMLIVTIDGARVALPADRIDCVIELGALTPVPKSSPAIAGLSTLRSRVLTVIDTPVAIGLHDGRSEEVGSHGRAVVVRHDGHDYALSIDAAQDVRQARAELDPLSLDVGKGWSRVALGVATIDDEAVLAVDIDRIIKHSEIMPAA